MVGIRAVMELARDDVAGQFDGHKPLVKRDMFNSFAVHGTRG